MQTNPTVDARDPNAAQAPNAFVVDLSGFNGPLELLLSLIRDEQVDIYDIPIARVCEQFLSRMHALELNEAAEYLEMAARLIRIKAQMLLPRKEGSDDWEDPRTELRAEIPAPGGRGSRIARFVGVDGPRWFLRGVISGEAVNDPEASAKVVELFRSIVVVRGTTPMPPRDLIPLHVPSSVQGATPTGPATSV